MTYMQSHPEGPRRAGPIYTGVFKTLISAYFFMLLLAFTSPAKAEISDSELRKLFIISGVWPAQMTGIEYGGIVLFKSYFETNKTACSWKKLHPDMTIFVDQEGGSVVRIPDAAPPSPRDSKKLTESVFYNGVKKSAKKLKDLCIDVNLAPMVEMSNGDSRSYGATAQNIVPRATLFSRAMQSEGIRTVLKHFPGWHDDCIPLKDLSSIKLKVKIGSEATKCRIGNNLAQFNKSISVFKEVPADAWMIGNNIYEELGPYPSTMNPEVIALVRNNLGYKGLVISDALWEIEAGPKAILMALKVNDWIMVAYPTQVEAAIPVIRGAIKSGFLTEAEIHEKLNRISKIKQPVS
jgi:beta-N-acetylhexosaminidase